MADHLNGPDRFLRHGDAICLQQVAMWPYRSWNGTCSPVVFLIGAAYTLKQEGHVRVDILFIHFSKKTKAWIDLFGTIVFLISLLF